MDKPWFSIKSNVRKCMKKPCPHFTKRGAFFCRPHTKSNAAKSVDQWLETIQREMMKILPQSRMQQLYTDMVLYGRAELKWELDT